MPKPVCLSCNLFYKPKRGGIRWIEGMPTRQPADRHAATMGPGFWQCRCGNELPLTERECGCCGAGTEEVWVPYKVWMGDVWQCPKCNHEIICGSGNAPFSEQHHHNFAKHVEGAVYTVNDC